MEFSRRDFMKLSLAAGLSLWTPRSRRARADGSGPARKTRACILLWLDGGPSHIDSFDPKPGVPEGGRFRAIDSAVPGLQFTEHLPKLAGLARDLAVVRSVTSPIADHGIANYLMHTGYAPEESVDHPSLGSILAKVWESESTEVPPYVFLGESYGDANSSRFGGGFLGDKYAPFTLGFGENTPRTLRHPEGVDDAEFQARMEWLSAYEERFAGGFGDLAETQRALRERAASYMEGPLKGAIDLSQEEDELRDAYGVIEDGRDPFGQGCLAARRLVQAGTKFVEVSMTGWDTHEDNFNEHEKLLRRLDAGFGTLIEDLKARGLFESTLVVCAGEFGRTPEINDQDGRDHHSEAFSVVLAGGGIRGGQAVGRTDERGAQVVQRPVTVPDLFATILTLAGVDLATEFRTRERRPIRVVNESGKAVSELL